jgi:lambda family phage portal protein
LLHWLTNKLTDLFAGAFDTSESTPDYEGASFSRRLQTWGTSTAGPNAVTSASLSTLRSRSRELRRNNPYAKSGVESMTANLIGRGLTPRFKTGNPELNKQIKELWDKSILELDQDGIFDFYGMQSMITDSLQEAGEALTLHSYRGTRSGLLVPYQVRLLEPDHLDESLTITLNNNTSIKMGVEFDRTGKRTAYHLWRYHPGDLTYFNNEVVRIPASQVLHIFRPQRIGQVRGTPWLTSIITRLRELDQYEDAELVRKKTAALFGAFVESPPGNPEDVGLPGEEVTYDYDGEDYISLEPGLIQYLKPGEKLTFSEPADVGGNYDPWIKRSLQAIAKGMGTTYENLTGDLAGVTYSSIRQGIIELRRLCRMIQNNILVHQFCRPVAKRWLDIAVTSGAISFPNYFILRPKLSIIFDPDGWDWVDPENDVKAEQIAVRSGFKSRTQVVAERGRDIIEVDAELSEEKKRADQENLTLDTDPGKVSSIGVKHREGQ